MTTDIFSEFISYDPEDGSLRWLKRRGDRDKNWNTRWAGREAMTATHKKGYLCGNFKGKLYLAHRVAWSIYYGSMPMGQIDHINGNKKDNRIINLRCVNNQENHMNMPLRSDNYSGAHGVTWDKRYSMWHSRIKSEGKTIHLGYFHKKEDALSARHRAEIVYEYHVNHGRPRGN